MTGEIPVAGLLTIDVAAELRKIGDGLLFGPWQAPAELVRRALASGARRVDVTLGRHAVRVCDDGEPLARSLVRAFAVVGDANRPAAERQAALVALEAGGATAPLALLAAAPSARLRVETGDAACPWRTTIAVLGLRTDRARAAEAVVALSRFAPAAIRLDGAAIGHGFGPTLAEAPLAAPLGGALALPAGDDVARVWLLLDGIVGAHLTLPAAPPFAAAVEMRPHVAGPAGPAQLRDAIEAHLTSLVDQAVDLALATSRGVADRSEADQRQLRSFLLTAARRRLRTADVLRVPLVRSFGHQGRERWLSLLDLGREARGADRTLWAVSSARDRAALASGVAPVVVLAADERSRLVELLDVSFRTPPEPRAPSLGDRVRAAVDAWRSGLRSLATVLRFGGGAVPDHALTADERAFARALAASLAEGGEPRVVRFTTGAGRARRSGSTWWLARDNRLVGAAVRAVARDPRWLYPAALAVFEGREPAGDARRRWLDQSVSS